MPSSAGPSIWPAASTRWPACTSQPTGRMPKPGRSPWSGWGVTCPSASSARSTMTTASAPGGMGAPVVMRTAVPGSTATSAT